MKSEFIKEYSENLKKLGFNVAAADSRYTEVQIAAGQAVNIGVIVDADEFDNESLKGFVDGYAERIAARAEGSRLANIFLVYIFVTGERRGDIDGILAEAEAFENQRIYRVYWAVSLGSSQVHHNKKQPGEIGGMSGAIAATLKKEKPAAVLEPFSKHLFLTYIFIALNGAAFALMGLALPSSDPQRIITAGAIVPERVLLSGEYWRIPAAMFIHFDAMHLAANCLSLYIFGSIVERFLGGFRFLVIYILSGLFAGALCLTQAQTVSAGASGAVYGLIGAAAVVTWRARGRAGLNLYNMCVLIAVGVGMSFIVPGISYTAHIGGLIAGTLLALILCPRSS